MSKNIQINAESISKVLESTKPTSLTGLWKALGGTGSVSGSASKKMREVAPDIETILAGNKSGTAKADVSPKSNKPTFQPSGKSKGVKKTSKTPKYPHIQANPFRPNSSYALAYDVLAAYPEGLPLATWRELYAKAAKKSLKLASFDTQVLLTAKDRSTSERHRSCRSGFYIERQCDHVTLKF